MAQRVVGGPVLFRNFPRIRARRRRVCRSLGEGGFGCDLRVSSVQRLRRELRTLRKMGFSRTATEPVPPVKTNLAENCLGPLCFIGTEVCMRIPMQMRPPNRRKGRWESRVAFL